MPLRPDFWNIPEWAIALMYVFLSASVLAMVAQLWERMRLWRVGYPSLRFDRLPFRLARLIKYGLAQVKIAHQPYAGVMHLSMFWALVALFIGAALLVIDSNFVEILTGDVYRIYELTLDGCGLFLALGLGLAMVRRWAKRPPGLTFTARFSGGLAILFGIVLTGLLVEGLRLAVQQPTWAAWSPVGNLVGQALRATGLAEATMRHWHIALWLTRVVLIGVFIVILPQDTLYLHVITAPLNIFFSDPERPRGALLPIEDIEGAGALGVGKLSEFARKTLLDGDACTECGRCQVVCPAYLAGRPLNPKRLILDIRDHLWARGPALLDGLEECDAALIGDVIQAETLWSCTTCYACVHECPVLIRHIDAIVDLRRHLTLVQGRPYETLEHALAHVERSGNPWGRAPAERLAWARNLPVGLDVPLMAERKVVDVFYWVGCAGSFDSHAQKTTLAMIEILKLAGVDFAVLGEQEFCTCDFARRAGNEYLYQLATGRILETLGQYSFNRILTQCPHCFNTFKNEYPQFGADFQVVHHSQFIAELISSGQLELKTRLDQRVTFHDPCYLGRYNDVYDAPRRVLQATGVKLVEMARSREKSLCCGGGGAKVWFELKDSGAPSTHRRPGSRPERVQEMRLEEAMSHDVDSVAVACPFCRSMLNSAAQSKGVETEVALWDIAELVAEAL